MDVRKRWFRYFSFFQTPIVVGERGNCRDKTKSAFLRFPFAFILSSFRSLKLLINADILLHPQNTHFYLPPSPPSISRVHLTNHKKTAFQKYKY